MLVASVDAREWLMSRVSTCLNFMGNTEEVFTFYASVFGTEFSMPINQFGDMSAPPGAPELPEHEHSLVLHVELPILTGHVIMGTDMLESMGHELRAGNNTTLNLEPDTRDETERLFAALSEGGSDTVGLDLMPWGS
jgi:PhnB protein